MQSLPALKYLMKASALNGYGDIAYAIVDLSPQTVDLILERIEKVSRLHKEDSLLAQIAYWDWEGVGFYSWPNDYRDRHEEEPEYQWLEEVANDSSTYSGLLFVGSRLAGGINISTYYDKMSFGGYGVQWQASRSHPGDKLISSIMTYDVVWRARLYHTPGDRRDDCFLEIARRDPRLALSILKEGLVIRGLDPIHVARKLSPQSLAPLLDHPDREIREQALLAFQELAPNRAKKTRRRRGH